MSGSSGDSYPFSFPQPPPGLDESRGPGTSPSLAGPAHSNPSGPEPRSSPFPKLGPPLTQHSTVTVAGASTSRPAGRGGRGRPGKVPYEKGFNPMKWMMVQKSTGAKGASPPPQIDVTRDMLAQVRSGRRFTGPPPPPSHRACLAVCSTRSSRPSAPADIPLPLPPHTL